MGRKQRGRKRKLRSVTKSSAMPSNSAKKETKLNNINLDETNSDLIKLEEKEGDATIEVECGTNKADLYISKLCQGSKGQCIYFRDSWLTPNEYQFISGRESAKDWKRSIKHDGKSLKLLYEKGIFKIHKASCGCNGGRTLTSCFRRTEENNSLIPKLSNDNTENSKDQDDQSNDKTDSKQSDSETDEDADDKCGTKGGNEDDLSESPNDQSDSNDNNISTEEESSEADEGEDVNISPDCENEIETVESKDSISNPDENHHSEETIQYIPPEDSKQIDIPAQNDAVIDDKCDDVENTDSLQSDNTPSNIPLFDKTPLDFIPRNRIDDSPKPTVEDCAPPDICVSETASVVRCVGDDAPGNIELVQSCVSNSQEKAIGQVASEKEMEFSSELCNVGDDTDINNSEEETITPNDETNLVCDDVKSDTPCQLDHRDSQSTHPKLSEEVSSTLLVKEFQQDEKCGNVIEPSTPTDDASSTPANNCYPKRYNKKSQSPPRESKLSSIINQLRSAKERELTETVTSTPDLNKKKNIEKGTPGNVTTKKEESREPLPTIPPPQNAMQNLKPATIPEHDPETKSVNPVQQSTLPRRQKIQMDSQSEKTTKFFNNKCNSSGRMSPVTGKTAEDIPDYKGPGGNLSYDDYMKALAGMKPHLPFPPVSVEQFALQKNKNVPPSGKKPESAQIPAHNLHKEKIPSFPKQEAVFPPAVYPHLLGAHLAFPWQHVPFLGLNPFMPLQLDSLTKKQLSSKQPDVEKKPERPTKRQNRCDETALDLSNKKPKLNDTLDSKITNDRLNSRPMNCVESNSTANSPKAKKYSHVGQSKDTNVKYSRFLNNGRAMDSVSSWINHSSVNKSTKCTCKYNSKSDMINWDVDDVCQFVKNIPGCAQYVKKFHEHKVNGQCLPLLTTEQLTKCLKMTIGPALILTHSVARKISETRNLMKCEHCRPRDSLTVKTAI